MGAFDWEIRDFQNLNPDFPIEPEIRKRISPQGGFQLRNPNPDFLDFPFCRSIGKSEKRNSGVVCARIISTR